MKRTLLIGIAMLSMIQVVQADLNYALNETNSKETEMKKTVKKKTKKVKIKDTIVCFLLDETGSMMPIKQKTISGFNEYVDSMKQADEDVLFSLTTFNAEKIETSKLKDIDSIESLTEGTYNPISNTPLYDAIGQTIKKMENFIKALPRDDNEYKILFVTLTDGEENSSKEFTRQAIFDLVKQKEKSNWTFVYLGANQDSWLVAQTMGYQRGNVANYNTAEMKAVMTNLGSASVSFTSDVVGSTNSFFQGTKNELTDELIIENNKKK